MGHDDLTPFRRELQQGIQEALAHKDLRAQIRSRVATTLDALGDLPEVRQLAQELETQLIELEDGQPQLVVDTLDELQPYWDAMLREWRNWDGDLLSRSAFDNAVRTWLVAGEQARSLLSKQTDPDGQAQ